MPIIFSKPLKKIDEMILSTNRLLLRSRMTIQKTKACIEPTVINGKVYVAADDHFSVFF